MSLDPLNLEDVDLHTLDLSDRVLDMGDGTELRLVGIGAGLVDVVGNAMVETWEEDCVQSEEDLELVDEKLALLGVSREILHAKRAYDSAMTVGKLKRIIADLPDDMAVYHQHPAWGVRQPSLTVRGACFYGEGHDRRISGWMVAEAADEHDNVEAVLKID